MIDFINGNDDAPIPPRSGGVSRTAVIIFSVIGLIAAVGIFVYCKSGLKKTNDKTFRQGESTPLQAWNRIEIKYYAYLKKLVK